MAGTVPNHRNPVMFLRDLECLGAFGRRRTISRGVGEAAGAWPGFSVQFSGSELWQSVYNTRAYFPVTCGVKSVYGDRSKNVCSITKKTVASQKRRFALHITTTRSTLNTLTIQCIQCIANWSLCKPRGFSGKCRSVSSMDLVSKEQKMEGFFEHRSLTIKNTALSQYTEYTESSVYSVYWPKK